MKSRSISAINRDDLTDKILENDRVCEKHFASGRAAKSLDKPLGHTKNTPKSNVEAAAKRGARIRKQKRPSEAARLNDLAEEIPSKRKKLNEPMKRKLKTMPGCAVHQWQKEMINVFGKDQLGLKPAIEVPMGELPSLCTDPKMLSKARKISLRSAPQTLTSDSVELKQFDPNFFSRGNILCRYPGCEQRKRRQSEWSKEDLYLCASHRKRLEIYVMMVFNEKGVDVSVNHSKEDLEDYTSLIGTMEKAFDSLNKQAIPFDWPLFGKKTGIAKEVFLNMRNYLIIVNALLNPDSENICTALNSTMAILNEFLQILRNDGEVIIKRLRELVDLLRIVIEHILFAFGTIYTWIYLPLAGNPAAQLGTGIGGFVGMAGFGGGPLIGSLTTMAGALFGGLIGNSVYNIWYAPQGNDEADHESIRRYQEFANAQNEYRDDQLEPNQQAGFHVHCLTGTPTGDLRLVVLVMGCFTIAGIPGLP